MPCLPLQIFWDRGQLGPIKSVLHPSESLAHCLVYNMNFHVPMCFDLILKRPERQCSLRRYSPQMTDIWVQYWLGNKMQDPFIFSARTKCWLNRNGRHLRVRHSSGYFQHGQEPVETEVWLPHGETMMLTRRFRAISWREMHGWEWGTMLKSQREIKKEKGKKKSPRHSHPVN